MDIEYEAKSITDPTVMEEMDRVFSFPVYCPAVCHPNIVKNPEGEWVFILAFGIPTETGEAIEMYINISLPINVLEQMLPNMQGQIKHFHETGGQKSRTN